MDGPRAMETSSTKGTEALFQTLDKSSPQKVGASFTGSGPRGLPHAHQATFGPEVRRLHANEVDAGRADVPLGVASVPACEVFAGREVATCEIPDPPAGGVEHGERERAGTRQP